MSRFVLPPPVVLSSHLSKWVDAIREAGEKIGDGLAWKPSPWWKWSDNEGESDRMRERIRAGWSAFQHADQQLEACVSDLVRDAYYKGIEEGKRLSLKADCEPKE